VWVRVHFIATNCQHEKLRHSALLASNLLNGPALTLGADSAAVNCTCDGRFIQDLALGPAKGRECLLNSVSPTADYVIVFLRAVLLKAGLAGSSLSNRA
jgi:hypothetical protein